MTAGRPLFDRVVIAGWSDADVPTRGDDSIWRASVDASTREVFCTNHATRHHATRALIEELAATDNQRVFLGFDFPLGFPTGFADRLLRGGANWRAVWTAIDETVTDDEHNANNKYDAGAALNSRAGMSPGPFWGCPEGTSYGSVLPTRPSTFAGLGEFRIAEQRLARRGIESPAVWQLHGDGAPGARTLLGAPLIRELAERSGLARRVRLWPFETGITDWPTRGSDNAIVVGEVSPRSFPVDERAHSLPDAAQTISTAKHIAELDRTGQLGALFQPELRADDILPVEREEGWILGA